MQNPCLAHKASQRLHNLNRKHLLCHRFSGDAHKHLMRRRVLPATLSAHDIEVDHQRCTADVGEVRRDIELLVQNGWREELRVHELSRQPDVEPFEDLPEWKPGCTKYLGLGEFEEPQVSAVANYSSEVDITPSYVFRDYERANPAVSDRLHSDYGAEIVL